PLRPQVLDHRIDRNDRSDDYGTRVRGCRDDRYVMDDGTARPEDGMDASAALTYGFGAAIPDDQARSVDVGRDAEPASQAPEVLHGPLGPAEPVHARVRVPLHQVVARANDLARRIHPGGFGVGVLWPAEVPEIGHDPRFPPETGGLLVPRSARARDLACVIDGVGPGGGVIRKGSQVCPGAFVPEESDAVVVCSAGFADDLT